MLSIITGNKNKFEQVRAIIPEAQQLDIDLIEIQELDPKKVIEHKIKEVFKQTDSEVFVEDTCLYLEGLNGLPGVLTKWFIKSIGAEGIYKMAQSFGCLSARAETLVGYAKDENQIYFFQGEDKGTIVAPRGALGFGWDSIFVPEGLDRTYGEMEFEERAKTSMRRIAVQKLKDFLEKDKVLI